MHHFFVSEKISGAILHLTDSEQLHHIKDVLRLKPDEKIILFDVEGYEFLASIRALEKGSCTIEILKKNPAQSKKARIAIACAIPRKSGMDEIIDKLTQLDIDMIIPLETERSIVRLSQNSAPADRTARWEKITRNAAEQSQRNTLPLIKEVRTFSEMLVQTQEFDLKLIPTLEISGKPIREIAREARPSSVIALIGPEGDFTAEEVNTAVKSGFIPISLGPTVLRVDTAAMAVASFLKFWLK